MLSNLDAVEVFVNSRAMGAQFFQTYSPYLLCPFSTMPLFDWNSPETPAQYYLLPSKFSSCLAGQWQLYHG